MATAQPDTEFARLPSGQVNGRDRVIGTHRSRPVSTDGCSMFARTPRYTPAQLCIHSAARMHAIGQNGSSRYVLALFDTSSERRIKCRSGLLIRGFGVQVPGGAPETAWGLNPRSFSCPGSRLRSWLLFRGQGRAIAPGRAR